MRRKTPEIGRISGVFDWWALPGSNRRHPRCKDSRVGWLPVFSGFSACSKAPLDSHIAQRGDASGTS